MTWCDALPRLLSRATCAEWDCVGTRHFTGAILSDYATLMVEILKDNERPEASAIYGAIDMPWARLVGQIAQAYGK